MIGHKSGSWTVVSEGEKYTNYYGVAYDTWVCRCTCGKERVIGTGGLLSNRLGACESCARKITKECSQRTRDRNTKHGKSKSREYSIWASMIQMCINPKHPSFKSVGEKGIRVSTSWRNSFSEFYKDMGDSPEGMWIRRVDQNLDFSAENCFWGV